MLVRLGLVEQRLKAVHEVLDGATVVDVAERYGVARQTVHTWLKNYATGGMAGLVDKSSRPAVCPHQMPAVMEARIVELRRAHPRWGPQRILDQLALDGADGLPGRSSVYRCLVRHKLIDPKQRKRRKSDYKRWERSRPMELWQMDVVGGVMLADGWKASIVSGIDDHSRFIVSAHVARRATARPVCDALGKAMRIYGVPEEVLGEDDARPLAHAADCTGNRRAVQDVVEHRRSLFSRRLDLGQHGIIGVGVDLDVISEIEETRAHVLGQPEIAAQIVGRSDLNLEIAEIHAALVGVRDPADRQAGPERGKQKLHWIDRRIGAAQGCRLIGLERERARLGHRHGAVLPCSHGFKRALTVIWIVGDVRLSGLHRREIDICARWFHGRFFPNVVGAAIPTISGVLIPVASILLEGVKFFV